MREILVDTDVFSFVFKGDSRADAFEPHLDGNRLFLSFVSVAELYRWALLRNWGDARIAELRSHIAACGILEPNDPVRWQWAKLMSVKGKPMGPADAWIAALALVHDIPLATNNVADFAPVDGLQSITA